MQTHVITEKQARQITGGRKPLVPVEYEEACKALDACESIDDAKYWSDKSDALAAWAKIYHDDMAGAKAKRLKLKAFHRLGTLARELQPGGIKKGFGRGAKPGPNALLVEKGLSVDQATKAITISRASRTELQPHIEKAHGIERVVRAFRGRSPFNRRTSSDAWLWLTGSMGSSAKLQAVASALRARTARQVAAELNPGECLAARELATEIIEWLDEFEQHLPKDGK